MEYQTIKNLPDTTSGSVPRFITKKMIEVHDQSGGSYNINKQIRFKIPVLRSDLCDLCELLLLLDQIMLPMTRD